MRRLENCPDDWRQEVTHLELGETEDGRFALFNEDGEIVRVLTDDGSPG